MKKKMLFCICIALYNVIVVYAAPVSRDNARQKAESFFRKHGDSRQFSSIASVKSRAGFVNDSPYYICVPDSGDGFVIVSGDDALPEIVGYSFDSSSDSIPLPLSAYLSSYASLVADVGRKQISEKVCRQRISEDIRSRSQRHCAYGGTWLQRRKVSAP